MTRITTTLTSLRSRICTREMLLVALVTCAASIIGSLMAGLPVFSLFGALIIALIIGMLVQIPMRAWLAHAAAKHTEGVGNAAALISNKLLRLGIILLGFKLNLDVLFATGVKTIAVAAIIVTLTITVTYLIARKLGVDEHLAILTAGGTGICGAAAVMGLSGSITMPKDEEKRGRDDEVMAVATVAVMGTVFALAEIALRPFLGLSDAQFGTMGGASLHEIAHAVAVGGSAGDAGMDAAIIMKLSRVLMLAPTAMIIGAWWARRHPQPGDGPRKVPIPWFMLGFLVASVAGTYLPFVAQFTDILVKAAYLVLGMAMAALGMNVDFKAIASRGRMAVLASFLASILLAGGAFVVAKLMF
ncbi:YeiH family protein [uncultured Bifidobacterium sp.]|uniref:YeiH family protein n=1 Tax=Bifidobacterium boum TaxID=78343 RepID=UPI002583B997|nr:putative sulfate exporter family transporter [uncultured Bifidobacterium sp.]